MAMLVTRPYLMKSDVIEKKDEYVLKVDLPGCDKKDIRTYLDDGYLVIEADLNKQDEEKEGQLIRSERYSGTYSRSFYVGTNLSQDEISASFRNGVLRLVIPKISRKEKEKTTIEIG